MKRVLIVMIITGIFTHTKGQDMYDASNASNKLAFELYKRFSQDDSKNIFFSPFSLNIALGMTYAGAQDETKKEMAQVLGFPLDDKNLHKELGNLQEKFGNLVTDGVEISIANQLWADKEYRFKCGYLRGVKRAYGAPIKRLEFRNKPNDCRLEINNWVEEQTKNRIKDLLPQGSISDLTALVLTNAIYFKGQWDNKFEETNTKQSQFITLEGNKVDCEMMNGQNKYNLYQGNNIQLLELPYVGKDFSMLVLLPNEEVSLKEIEKNLTLADFKQYLDLMSQSDVKVSLPKFKFEWENELKPILMKMGMPLAFSNLADFTRMSKKPDLKIDEVYHKAFVEVSEEGTEAAAATAVVIVRKSVSMPVNFLANRPFMFFIRENSTGNILFMGRLTNPAN
jgi:serpin B